MLTAPPPLPHPSLKGVASEKMFYIKEGRVELVLTRKGAKDLPLATRQVRAGL